MAQLQGVWSEYQEQSKLREVWISEFEEETGCTAALLLLYYCFTKLRVALWISEFEEETGGQLIVYM
jgi:hypothetical protein